MTKEELNIILEKHRKWLNGEDDLCDVPYEIMKRRVKND